jgi:hypothetical protein
MSEVQISGLLVELNGLNQYSSAIVTKGGSLGKSSSDERSVDLAISRN